MADPNVRRLHIFLIGASGIIGDAVIAELGPHHHIVRAGPNDGDLHLDLGDPASIANALDSAGKLDAVVCTAGSCFNFAPMSDIKPASIAESQYGYGITHKLMGQVNLALGAREHLNPGGSITLISGILSTDPIYCGSSGSMVNGAIESFVRAAAVEMPRSIRINAVSPGVPAEAMGKLGAYFRGFEPVPASRIALAFRRSVEGHDTGQIYRVV